MAGRKVAPTKTNLINLSRELSFAKLGHELLDQKRNILILELMNLVDQAADYESQVHKALETAYRAFEQSVLHSGKLQSIHIAAGVNIDATITMKKRIMVLS